MAELLLLGERLAGKTTAIIAAVTSGGLDFLANDQVMLLPNHAEHSAKVLGYPALIKVREGSGELLSSIPWARSLWMQADDARPGSGSRTAVFAPSDLYGALSRNVVPQAELAAVVLYTQSPRPGELSYVDATVEADYLWRVVASLPLEVAYDRRLMDVAATVLGSRPSTEASLDGWPRGTQILRVRCGSGSILDLGKLLETFTQSAWDLYGGAEAKELSHRDY